MKTSNQFILLKDLVENKGEDVSFDEIEELLRLGDIEITTYTKKKIKDMVEEIKTKLGIKNNPAASISIRVIDDYVKLVPNPSAK